MCLCVHSLGTGVGNTVKAVAPIGSTGEGASKASQGLGLQHAHALELPRGALCLTWSIPSTGKRSNSLPGAEDPLVTAETLLGRNHKNPLSFH